MARTVSLPTPRGDGGVSLERCLRERRSVRSHADAPLSLAEVAQLLWATQGITSAAGERTAPSGGALYPLELYLVAGNVTGLPAGVYRYRPQPHDLVLHVRGDLRAAVAEAAVAQHWVAEGAAIVVLAAAFGRTTSKYGRRGVRYAHMEVGHAAQNLCLQAVALGLGSVVVGAFDDRRLGQLLQLRDPEEPLALVPVGR